MADEDYGLLNVDMSLTQDFVEWQEDEGQDLRKLFQSPNGASGTMMTQAETPTPPSTPTRSNRTTPNQYRHPAQQAAQQIPTETTTLEQKSTKRQRETHTQCPPREQHNVEMEVNGIFDILQHEETNMTHSNSSSNSHQDVQSSSDGTLTASKESQEEGTPQQGNISKSVLRGSSSSSLVMGAGTRHRKKRREALQFRNSRQLQAHAQNRNILETDKERGIDTSRKRRRHTTGTALGVLGKENIENKITDSATKKGMSNNVTFAETKGYKETDVRGNKDSNMSLEDDEEDASERLLHDLEEQLKGRNTHPIRNGDNSSNDQPSLSQPNNNKARYIPNIPKINAVKVVSEKEHKERRLPMQSMTGKVHGPTEIKAKPAMKVSVPPLKHYSSTMKPKALSTTMPVLKISQNKIGPRPSIRGAMASSDATSKDPVQNTPIQSITPEEKTSDPDDDPFGFHINDEDLASMDMLMNTVTESSHGHSQQRGKSNASIEQKPSTSFPSGNNRMVETSHVGMINDQGNGKLTSHSSFRNTERQIKKTPGITISKLKEESNECPSAQLVISETPQSRDTAKDDFGDFPEIDFDAMDKLIEERVSSSQSESILIANGKERVHRVTMTPPSPTAPVWNQRRIAVQEKEYDQLQFLTFDRYKVRSITDDGMTYTKTLYVELWKDRVENKRVVMPEIEDSGPTTEQMRENNHAQNIDGCIFLRGEWYHTVCEPGDTIHLCSLYGQCRTDVAALPVVLHTAPPHGSDTKDDLVLVLNPDMLVTPTVISETVSCSRRAVLKARLGSSGLSSRAAIIGTMRHDLFEKCMLKSDFSLKTAIRNSYQIVREHAETLIGCGIHFEHDAREEVLRVLPQIQRFASEYTSLGERVAGNTTIVSGKNRTGNRLGDVHFCAQAVYATEESTVSSVLGLKGNVDATVEASITPDQNSVHNPNLSRSLSGLELKTGHNQTPQNAHMAQLALYTVMLRARHGSAPHGLMKKKPTESESRASPIGAGKGGMLLYLNHESYRAVHVSPSLGEIKSLLGQRNAHAGELRRSAKPRGVILEYEDEKENKHGKNSNAAHAADSTESKRITILDAPPAVLPDTIMDSFACGRCFSNRECMMYASASLSASPALQQSNRLPQSHSHLLQHFTSHLDQKEIKYFLDWDRLIDLESHVAHNEISKAWLVRSEERERLTGKCISSLVLDAVATVMDEKANISCDGEQTSYSNISLLRASDAASKTSFNDLKVEIGSRVVLSTDGTIFTSNSSLQSGSDSCDINLKGPISRSLSQREGFRQQMHILRGNVVDICDTNVTIRALSSEIGRVQRMDKMYCNGTTDKPKIRFRLDKDEITYGTGTLRQNLINLFTADVPQFTTDKKKLLERESGILKESNHILQNRLPRLRKAVVHLAPPQFDTSRPKFMFNSEHDSPEIVGCSFMDLALEFSELNLDQRAAVEKVISAEDYTLIQGLPGTGKTSTIAFVARLLAARGKRVLVTSYTHAAVDNLLLKLTESGVGIQRDEQHFSDVVRIGPKSACHPSIHSFLAPTIALEKEIKERTSRNDPKYNSDINHDEPEYFNKPGVESLYKVISAAKIVGVSALTIPRSPLLIGQHFDVVIVDEAGQIAQPAILGALMAADSCVLVGDHMQLPPLVVSDAAEEAGYGISMLKRLAETHPDAVAQLTLQYRMHGDICQLSNEIVYKGKLKCANEKVRWSKLDLPFYPSGVEVGWLLNVLDPNRPVVFIDTDAIRPSSSQTHITSNESFRGLERTRGRKEGGNIVNDTECTIVKTIVKGFMKSGLDLKSIGVICPYRSQLRLIDEDPFFAEQKQSGLEVSTIDRFQGRDKDAIVLSFVRSNSQGKAGRLLDDFRRLNVAVSRAKKKLILIGSFSTLSKGSSVMRPVLEGIKHRSGVESLPPNALQL